MAKAEIDLDVRVPFPTLTAFLYWLGLTRLADLTVRVRVIR